MTEFKRKLLSVFLLAFLLNWAWENLHSNLYLHYSGGDISQGVLFQATFLDAIFITLMAIFFLKVRFLRRNIWYALVFGVIAGMITEIYALRIGWWGYSELMPIVPIVNTGLTPTIQLGLLAYITYKIVGMKSPSF
ncbi:MAG: hypothetical protein WD898_02160 [Candidatus Paceibacterota bacterium]